MKKNPAKILGVTLIELLVVITLIGIAVVPLYFSYTRSQAKQSLKSGSEQLSDALREAHVYSREAKERRTWGVQRVNANTYAVVSSQDGTTWTEEGRHVMETGIIFPNDFFITFGRGTGETTAQSIIVENPYGARFRVDILQSGTVEVYSI